MKGNNHLIVIFKLNKKDFHELSRLNILLKDFLCWLNNSITSNGKPKGYGELQDYVPI